MNYMVTKRVCNQLARNENIFRQQPKSPQVSLEQMNAFSLGFTAQVLSFNMLDSRGALIEERAIFQLAEKIYLLAKSQDLQWQRLMKNRFFFLIFWLEKDVLAIQSKTLLGKGEFKEVYDGIYLKLNMDAEVPTIDKIHNVAFLNVFKDIQEAKEEDDLAENFSSPHIIKKSLVTFHWQRLWIMLNEKYAFDLEAVITGKVSLTLAQKIKVFVGAAKGLKYMHEKGYLHRDIKPANMAANSDGEGVLIDLGFTVKAEDVEDPFGSALYSSPETIDFFDESYEITENDKQNYNSDLWAFGVSLHEVMHPMHKLPSFFIDVMHSLSKLSDRLKKLHLPQHQLNFNDWITEDQGELKVQQLAGKLLSPKAEDRGSAASLVESLVNIG